MVLKQQKVNSKEKGNEKNQGKRKSNDNSNTRDRKKGGRGGGPQGKGGSGGRGEGKGSNKTDWKGMKYKASGPNSRCTLHKNSNHMWGDCSKNPNSANYRPNRAG